MRAFPMALMHAAAEHIDGDLSLSNTYRTGDGERCFGGWGEMAALVALAHISTLITMEEEFEDWAAPLGEMLSTVRARPLNTGVTFYFPGWLAVDEDGMTWEKEHDERTA